MLICDASSYVSGVLLGEHVNKKLYVSYCASHTMNGAKLNYTITRKEFFSSDHWFLEV